MFNLSPILWKLANLFIYCLPASYKMKTDDRRILEQIIFRDLCFNRNIQNILFVGCNKVTFWYPIIFNFFYRKNFMTIDPDIGVAKYGSKSGHYIMKFEDLLNNNKTKNMFDIIIINGVFGYGIDKLDSKLLALKKVHRMLNTDGKIIIGYSDFEKNPQFAMKMIDNKLFKKDSIPGLKTDYCLTAHHNRHAFRCFTKL